jgi:hypothetical protein
MSLAAIRMDALVKITDPNLILSHRACLQFWEGAIHCASWGMTIPQTTELAFVIMSTLAIFARRILLHSKR